MPSQDNIKALYDELKNTYDVGSEDNFRNYLSDSNNREALRKELADKYEVGDSAAFSAYLGYDAPAPAKPQEKPATSSGTPMSEEERRAMMDSTRTMMMGANQREKQAANKMQYATANSGLQGNRHIVLGQNNNVVEKEPTYNPDTGKIQPTYITESGNEYDSREGADLEQNIVDRQKYVETHLDKINREQVASLAEDIDAQIAEHKQNNRSALAYGPYYGGAAGRNETNNPEWNTLIAAQRSMRDAQRMINEADHYVNTDNWLTWLKEFGKGAARGFGEKLFDIDNWDMGLSDAHDAAAMRAALKAYDEGKKLTRAQQSLLDAKAVELATQAYFGSYVGRGYKAGEVTAESIPFMIEMCLNPAAGTGKTLQSMMARYALKRFSKNATRFAAKTLARLTGDIAGSAVMAGSTGIAGVAADTMERMNGETDYKLDRNGQAVYAGQKKKKDAYTAATEALTARSIQNFSEMMGEYFAPVLGKTASAVANSKFGTKIRLDKVKDFVEKVSANDIAKLVTDFEKHAKWNGTIAEYFEEVGDNVLNATLVGDQNFKIRDKEGKLSFHEENSVFNLSDNIDTFLGVWLMGGILSSAKTIGYRTPKYRARQDMKNADNMAAQVFGNQDTWGEIRNTIAFGNDEDIKNKLAEVKKNPELTQAQKAAVFKYAGAAEKYRGILIGEEKRRAEADPVQVDAETSFDNGYSLETPQELNDAKNNFDYQRKRAEDRFDNITGLDKYPIQTLQTMQKGGYSPEDIQLALDYVNAKATYDGMQQRVADDVEGQVSIANSTIDRRTNRDTGMVHPITLNNDHKGYVVGGELVMSDNGIDAAATKQANNDNMIFIADEEGKIQAISVDDIASADAPIDAAQEKAQAEQTIRQTYTQQAEDKMNGVLPFNNGDTYNVVDEEGQQHQVQVVETPAVEQQGALAPSQTDVIVSIDGGQPVQMPKQQVQDMYNAASLARLQQHEEEKQKAEAQKFPVGEQNVPKEGINGSQGGNNSEKPTYNYNDEVTLQTEQGEVKGRIVSDANSDGQYEVEVNTPDGLRVWQMTGEEIAAMTPQAAAEVDEQPVEDANAMPMIGEGEDAEPDFSKATPERAYAYIYKEADLPQDKADQFVEANKKVADSELKKIQKKEPAMGTSIAAYKKAMNEWQQAVDAAQERADYWKQIQDMRKAESPAEISPQLTPTYPNGEDAPAAPVVTPENVEEKVLTVKPKKPAKVDSNTKAWQEAKGKYGEYFNDDMDTPNDVMELVAMNMPSNINWEGGDGKRGLQAELGRDKKRGIGKKYSTNAFNSYLAPKGEGQSFDAAVHSIWESDNNLLPNGEHRFDDMDIRNALLDMFMGASKPSDIANYVLNNRIYMAEQAMRADQDRQEEYEEMQRMQQESMDKHNMSVEEYDSWLAGVEEIAPIREEYEKSQENFDISNNNSNFAGNDRGTEENIGGIPSEGAREIENGRPSSQESSRQVQGQTSDETRVPEDTAGGNAETEGRTEAGTRIVREYVKNILDQAGVDVSLADRMSDEQIHELNGLINDWEKVNDKYGRVIEEQDKNLKSKDKAVREAAQEKIDAAQEEANEAFEPVERYIRDLQLNELSDEELVKFVTDWEAEAKDEDELYGNADYVAALDIMEEHDLGERTGETSNTSSPEEIAAEEKPYTSFEELVADTDITVKDPARKKAMRQFVDKIFKHGSSNHRKDKRGAEYIFVYLTDATNKADRKMLEPWYSSKKIEYNDNNPTATWVDEGEQRIYFVKYAPKGVGGPDWDMTIAGYKQIEKPVGETAETKTTEPQDANLIPRDAEEEKIVADVTRKLQEDIDAAIKARNKAASDLQKARAKESDRATDLFGNDNAFNQQGQLFDNSEMPVDQSAEGVSRRTQTEQEAFNEAVAVLNKLQSPQERNSRIRGALDNHRNQTSMQYAEGEKKGVNTTTEVKSNEPEYSVGSEYKYHKGDEFLILDDDGEQKNCKVISILDDIDFGTEVTVKIEGYKHELTLDAEALDEMRKGAVDNERNKEIKREVEGFKTETPEEAADFDARIKDMTDPELLAYMAEDGKGDVNKAYHVNLYDEYDSRHIDEEVAAHDSYSQILHDNGVTKEQAEEMLFNLRKDISLFTTADRPELLGQDSALEEYIQELEAQEEQEAPEETQQESPVAEEKEEALKKRNTFSYKVGDEFEILDDNGETRKAKVVRMGHIEDFLPEIKNRKDEETIEDYVSKMSAAEAKAAYKRINAQMLDEDGLNLDEHFEKTKREWIDKHGLKGVGKQQADELQKAIDKYGAKMVELRWNLMDRLIELDAFDTSLFRDGDDVTGHVNSIPKRYGLRGGAMFLVVNGKKELDWLRDTVSPKAFELVMRAYNRPGVTGTHVFPDDFAIIFAEKCPSPEEAGITWWHEQTHSFFDSLPQDMQKRYGDFFLNYMQENYPEEYEKIKTYEEPDWGGEACAYFAENIIREQGADNFMAANFVGGEEISTFANELREYLRNGKEGKTNNRPEQGEDEGDALRHGNSRGRNDQPQGRERGTAEGEESPRASYRIGDDFSDNRDKAIVRDHYERMMQSGLYQFREAVQDSMLSLRRLMEEIDKASGGKGKIEDIASFENAYTAENAMSSASHAQQDLYGKLLFKPLLKEVNRLAKENSNRDEVTRYMIAKHGLERNRVMAEQAYKKYQEEHPYGKKTLDDFRERDYAGLTALTGEEDVAAAEAMAQQMVDDFEQAHDTKDLWELTNACTKATLEKIYKGGLLSKDVYEGIRDMYEYYIPLRGFDEKTSDEVYGYLNHDAPAYGSVMKSAKGRSSMADDPLAVIANMADAGIMQANRNIMKQKFLKFVLNHPSDAVSVSDMWLRYDDVNDEWEVITADISEKDTPDEVQRKTEAFEERMKVLAETDPEHYKRGRDAVNVPIRTINGTLKEHQIHVKMGGKDYILTINGNPRAAQALNGLTNPDTDANGAVGKILKAAEAVNRQMSLFYTTRNPEFVLSNFLRDAAYANSTMWVRESPNYAYKFNKNFVRVNPAVIYRLIQKYNKGTLDMNNEVERAFYDFMINGGETGYTNIKDVEKQKKLIKKYLKEGNKAAVNTQLAWEIMGEKLDEINRSVENCARFAAFLTSRQMGRSVERSVWDAKEVSVNFNKKGAGSKFLDAKGQTLLGNAGAFISGLGRSGYVFWNASIQGLTNFMRLHKNHTGKALAYDAALFFALGMVIAGYGGGDDDDYYNLPEWVRRNNICIKIPGTHSYLKLPLGIEMRAIYGMGELAASILSGKERKSDEELAMSIISQLSQTMPLDLMEGGRDLFNGKDFAWSTVSPTYVKPLFEIADNRNWMGMPIYDDSPWKEGDPEWTKAGKRTNKWLVNFSRWSNELSKDDDERRGWANWNPSKVEHVFEGMLGGYATTVSKLMKAYEMATGEMPFDWSNALFASRVLASADENVEAKRINSEYYKYYEEYKDMKKLINEYKQQQRHGALDVAEKIATLNYSPRYGHYMAIGGYVKGIDKIRSMLNKGVASPEAQQRMEKMLLELKRDAIEAVRQYDDSVKISREVKK